MACAYLLTLADLPRPPRAANVEESATQRAEALMNSMPADVDAAHELSVVPDRQLPPRAPAPSTLDDVLQLHTAGRMKRPSSPGARPKHGVSIPSQRRWLYYRSLLLARTGPQAFWAHDDRCFARLPGAVDGSACEVRGFLVGGRAADWAWARAGRRSSMCCGRRQAGASAGTASCSTRTGRCA